MSVRVRGNTKFAEHRRPDDGQRNRAEDMAMARAIQRQPALYSAELQTWAASVLRGGDGAE